MGGFAFVCVLFDWSGWSGWSELIADNGYQQLDSKYMSFFFKKNSSS
jgi:hypothetical protein